MESQVVQDEQVRGQERPEGAVHRDVHPSLGHGFEKAVGMDEAHGASGADGGVAQGLGQEALPSDQATIPRPRDRGRQFHTSPTKFDCVAGGTVRGIVHRSQRAAQMGSCGPTAEHSGRRHRCRGLGNHGWVTQPATRRPRCCRAAQTRGARPTRSVSKLKSWWESTPHRLYVIGLVLAPSPLQSPPAAPARRGGPPGFLRR